MKERHPHVTAHLEDARRPGRHRRTMGTIANSNWVQLHGVLDRREIPNISSPCASSAWRITAWNTEAPRRLYLESRAFYPRNRKPFHRETPVPRSRPGPFSNAGMLPRRPPARRRRWMPPVGARSSPAGQPPATLQYRVEPERAFSKASHRPLERWPVVQPMAGGNIRLDPPRTGTASVTSAALAQGTLSVRWQGPVEWQAAYVLRGNTLVVDVACKGGSAAGLGLGEIPPACPEGRTIAVTLPDLRHGPRTPRRLRQGGLRLGALRLEPLAVQPHLGPSRRRRRTVLALMDGTDYYPLTDASATTCRSACW
jgi:hypothetical protein